MPINNSPIAPGDSDVGGVGAPKHCLLPLELFHPEGTAEVAIVVGNNCPRHLFSVCNSRDSKEAGLIVWAPTDAECNEPGWLERSASMIAQKLAPEGVAYAMVPRAWRRKARRILKDHNLQLGTYYAHLPDWSSSRYLVSLTPAAAQYAFWNLFPTRDMIRTLALALLHLPGGDAFMGTLIPWAGFTARWPGSRSLADWLYRLAGIELEPRSTLFTTTWRQERCSVAMHCFEEKARPKVVAKAVWPAASDYDQSLELNNLAEFGESARLAGARIPWPVNRSRVGQYPVLLQTALEGRSAAAVVAGHPEKIPEIMGSVVTWLVAWNRSTRTCLPLAGERLERELLTPASALAHLMPGGEDYKAWLDRCCALESAPVPFVAAHRDLTLWNILLQPGSPPGIVDWTEARRNVLPLGDLFHAMVDAVTIGHKLDREIAFQECFIAQGQYFFLVTRYLTHMRKALDIREGMANLCLHACFLHHAINEQRERSPEDPQPFLAILRRLVRNREILAEF